MDFGSITDICPKATGLTHILEDLRVPSHCFYCAGFFVFVFLIESYFMGNFECLILPNSSGLMN